MDYAQLLAQHDDPTHWEYPPGFDYQAATARFAKFVEALSVAIGEAVESETGAYIQDASFHSQAFPPLPGGRRGLIRFSNFGDMVTIDDGETLPEPTLSMVLEMLAQYGYTYVPAAVLEAPYTGSNPDIRSWWIRYFDWL